MNQNSITQEQIDTIMSKSVIKVTTIHDKCTVVSAKLPNGFVITESSACVDLANYDERQSVAICKTQIENKVWELEGYRLRCELSNK